MGSDKDRKTTNIEAWSDKAMFKAEPHPGFVEGMGVLPKVTLLSMTHEPLAAIAAMCAMYEGNVVRNYKDMTLGYVEEKWSDAMSTHLTAPLESVKFQFQIDGVDRAFTHQMVRQRTACYAQESMRFAVVEDLPHNTTLAPWFHGNNQLGRDRREMHDKLMAEISRMYTVFINQGCPAEDARSVLPTNVATRIIYDTNLRNLADHAGNRLCTQAQFHWKMVFNGIIGAIADYGARNDPDNIWQYLAIAESNVFRPICYKLGKCPFKASFDRACNIRERVDAFAERGVDSSQWHEQEDGNDHIVTSDWLMEGAARVK